MEDIDIYKIKEIEQYCEEDEMNADDQGFMLGYLEA